MYYVANFSAKDKVNIYLAVCKSLNEPNRTALNECIQCRTLKYRASLIRAYVLPQKANTDFSRSASRCMLCIYTLEIPSVLVHFFLLCSVVDFSFDFSLFLVRIFLFPIAFALIPYTNILILQIPSQMLFFYVSTSTDKVCTHIHGHFIPWNKCSFWSWRLLFIILSLNICLLTFAHFELSNVICYIIFLQNLPDRPYVFFDFRFLSSASWNLMIKICVQKVSSNFFLLLFFIKDALFPRITVACNKINKQRFKLPYLFPFYTYKYVRYV